jgi:hypothetical protein
MERDTPMRKPIAAALLMVAVPFAAAAGEIYGTIAANLEVKVLCGDQSQNAFTDERGSYRLYISRQGECKLSARRGSGTWSEPLTIYSSERPARYDLLIKGNRLERQ